MLTALACYLVLCFSVAHICDMTMGKPDPKGGMKRLITAAKILLWGWAIPIKVLVLAPLEYLKEDVLPMAMIGFAKLPRVPLLCHRTLTQGK
jgi:hypothetical protein